MNPEEIVEQDVVEVPQDEQIVELSVEEQLQNRIEELENELSVTKNAYFKAYADTENLKKRLQNDADTARKYRIQGFAQEILPVIDNLERALQNLPEDETIANYFAGFKMIYDQLMNALKNEGVVEIEALNQPFDPNFHQSLMQEATEGVEANTVVEVFQKGYKLKDRILRPALVKISA
ncbi:MAG: nucleotide exchange factor GrpE [Erysipelotrichaceae bacterium]